MAQILMSDYLAVMSATPFAWGRQDCATFVIGWFDRMTGRDGMRAWQGQYDNEQGCRDFITRNGGFEVIAGAFLGSHYGAVPRDVPRTGDAVFCAVRGIEAMGLALDGGSVALRTTHGVLVIGGADVLACWGTG